MIPVNAILSLGMGYCIGCLSPAAFVAKKKNVDLTAEGTKNLGATNTALVLGRYAGYFVLIFDILKSYIAYRMARRLYPALKVAGLIAGIGVLIGHCFPVTMGFRGGKGLASFGGLVLAHDIRAFAFLLTLGIIMAFVMNYGVYLAVTATVLFPVTCWVLHGDLMEALMCAIVGGFIFAMHLTNLRRAITGEDPIHMRDGLEKIFGKKK